MTRLGILLTTLLVSTSAMAQTFDVDRVARAAALKADGIYRREGIAGLRDAFDACIDGAARSRKPKAATACAAMGWTMVYIDLLAIDALHVPATIDVERTSSRIAAVMTSAGLTTAEANRLRPFVVQFVGTGGGSPTAGTAGRRT